MVPHANDPLMSGRSILLLRHLECQNTFIISEDIGRARMVQQFWRIGGGVGEGVGSDQSTVGLGDVIDK